MNARPRVRLIALDIDGTLVGPDQVIGERTRAAVAEASRRGISVVLITGRMTTGAVGFARALGLPGPVAGLHGAVIRSMPDPGAPRFGRVLFHRPIAPDTARDVIAWCRSKGMKLHLNHLERMIMERQALRLDDAMAFYGSRPTVIERAEDWAPRPVTKLVGIDDAGHSPALLEEARARFAGRVEVTMGHPLFMEFLAGGVSKGAAVRWLARREGVPLADCMAVGDQLADLDMIVEVGHGVAMPTAPEGVKAAAAWVAPPVEEEGAAQAIERFALGGWSWHGPAAGHGHEETRR